ncbi:MAG TPA: hypothetical protein VGS22_18895 [Thermoanaerobaculia bacterium]|jgi:hypothetical protein|nr:hypothetical protein [Thermoanaerobaculia bacterium]
MKLRFLVFTLLLVLAAFAGSAALAQIDPDPLPLCLRAIPFPPSPEITTYEELTACGLYAQETRLECILEIKRPSCYGTAIDGFGAFEHVLFCIDWNGDAVFSQSEVVGEVTTHVHNESNGASAPWNYAVYRDFVPPGGPRTDTGNTTTTTVTIGPTFQARAILSYNTAPTGCAFVPQFGNVLDFPIRLDPIR